jgi:hypothetical protein
MGFPGSILAILCSAPVSTQHTGVKALPSKHDAAWLIWQAADFLKRHDVSRATSFYD